MKIQADRRQVALGRIIAASRETLENIIFDYQTEADQTLALAREQADLDAIKNNLIAHERANQLKAIARLVLRLRFREVEIDPSILKKSK